MVQGSTHYWRQNLGRWIGLEQFSVMAHMSDLRIAKSYWKAWQEFEVCHGNEDTFREMLRIKRSTDLGSTVAIMFNSS